MSSGSIHRHALRAVQLLLVLRLIVRPRVHEHLGERIAVGARLVLARCLAAVLVRLDDVVDDWVGILYVAHKR